MKKNFKSADVKTIASSVKDPNPKFNALTSTFSHSREWQDTVKQKAVDSEFATILLNSVFDVCFEKGKMENWALFLTCLAHFDIQDPIECATAFFEAIKAKNDLLAEYQKQFVQKDNTIQAKEEKYNAAFLTLQETMAK